MSFKIVIAGTYPEGTFEKFRSSLCDTAAELIEVKTQEEFETLEDADVILLRIFKMPEKDIARFPSLKAILRWGVGYDTVDIEAAGNRGIYVCNTPGANSHAVAELVVMMILILSRKILCYRENINRGQWAKNAYLNQTISLNNAGNYSEVIILENPGYKESTSTIPSGALTPEGTGTILDSVADGDKQFYTITSEAGNVFYLIIDGDRDSNNVYFLNGVTEEDLLALAEKSGGTISSIPAEEVCTCTDKCEAGLVNTGCAICKNELSKCKGTPKVTEPVETIIVEPIPEEDNTGTILILLIAVGAVCGAGYYVKIVRPKQQIMEDDFDEDDYGEGFDPDAAFGTPDTENYIDDEDGE